MSKIVITAPLGMEKDIYNILKNYAEEVNYEIISMEILAKEMQMVLKDKSLTEIRLMIGMVKETEELFDSENIIYLGQCSKKVNYDHFLVLFPDVVEAQEDLIETAYNYKEYFLTSKEYAEFSTNDMASLLKYIDNIVNKREEKLLN